MTLSYMSGLDDGRIIYATYLESIIQSLRGRYVKNGCNVSANASTLSVDIADGVVIYEGQEYTVAAENLALDTALKDKDRVDVIVWDYAAGTPTLSVITGTRWLTLADGSVIPITDRITDSQIPLAIVIVRAGATSVTTTTDVIDVRTGLDGINTINNIVSDNIHGVNELNGVTGGKLAISTEPIGSMTSVTPRSGYIWLGSIDSATADVQGSVRIHLAKDTTLGNTPNFDIYRVDSDGIVEELLNVDQYGTITTKNINPFIDNTYSLGTSLSRYANLYVVNATITNGDIEKIGTNLMNNIIKLSLIFE